MSITRTLSAYRTTLLLAVTLLILGAVAGYGALQLRRVIALQLRADAVAAICPALQRQQYDSLASLIDPTPVAPVASKAFDSRAFQSDLRTLDQRQGNVRSCVWRPIQLSDESALYLFTLHRPHVSAPIAMQVVLQHGPDNGWRISRSSPFTSHPV